MKHKPWWSAGFLSLGLALPATGDVIYSNLLNTSIPIDDFTGVTITIAGGTLNPFFGGAGVGNNYLLQPVRSGTGGLDPIQNLAVGSTIDASLLYATGPGGSQTHIGAGNFVAGQEGYLGFKLNNVDYGWARVVFTNNTGGAMIKDWAYDNSGAIVTGRIQQSAAVSGAQTVTLSPGSGETFTLGSVISNTGGNVNSVNKTGAGTTILSQSNTYTGSTTINGGTLTLVSAGSISNTSGVSLGTGGTFDVSAKSGGYTVNNLTGSGSVLGSLTVSTQLSIGNSPGTTTFQNLTLGTGSIYTYELTGGGTAADLGIVAGNLEINSGSALDLVQLGTYTMGDSFTLFGYSGSQTGNFKDIGGNTLADGSTFSDAGGLWMIHYDSSTPGLNGGMGTSFITITAVPEPGAALLGVLGTLTLLRRRRA